MQCELYFDQIGQTGRFQEPIDVEDWISGNAFESDLVDLASVDKVPVTLWYSGKDNFCPADLNVRLQSEI